jgi:succinate dehydrogenase / fumarate reductase, cytochrome b subunit
MAQDRARPLSPHISIWKWGPHMAASIINRVTGIGLATVGVGVLIYWLLALSGNKDGYAAFLKCANAWYGKVVLIGLTWAFFQHLCGGLRHFVLDTGAGYELKANRAGSMIVFLAPILLTAASWGYLWYLKG